MVKPSAFLTAEPNVGVRALSTDVAATDAEPGGVSVLVVETVILTYSPTLKPVTVTVPVSLILADPTDATAVQSNESS